LKTEATTLGSRLVDLQQYGDVRRTSRHSYALGVSKHVALVALFLEWRRGYTPSDALTAAAALEAASCARTRGALKKSTSDARALIALLLDRGARTDLVRAQHASSDESALNLLEAVLVTVSVSEAKAYRASRLDGKRGGRPHSPKLAALVRETIVRAERGDPLAAAELDTIRKILANS
jgi:hypothetical protein